MYKKIIKFASIEKLNLYYFFFNNNKFFLIFTTNKKYKYFTLPSNLNFQKEKQTFLFSSLKKDSFLLNNYLLNFNAWLKNNNKLFKKKLLLKGLGFRCFLSEDKLQIGFKIGFSHILFLIIPKNVNKISIEKNYLIVESDDISTLGDFCKKIKQLRLPDIYKGKGILYRNEIINLKAIKKS